MEERTYTQQEVDRRLAAVEEIHDAVIESLLAKHQEQRKNDQTQPFREAIGEEEGYVQYLLKQARAYLFQELLELEEEAYNASWKGIGTMHDGWYDYVGYVKGSLEQVEKVLHAVKRRII